MTLVINLLSAAAAYLISMLLFGLLYYAFTLGAIPNSNNLFLTVAWWVLIPLAFWSFPALALLIYLMAAWTSPGDDRARFGSPTHGNGGIRSLGRLPQEFSFSHGVDRELLHRRHY